MQLWRTASAGPRVVLITGASSGIGRATALRAAAAGDHVSLLARRRPELTELAEECRRGGAASAQVVVADVSQDADVARAVEEVLDQHSRLDAAIHCAGIVTYGRTESVDVDDFDSVLATNLSGSVSLARHVIPVFRRQEAGVLVLVGSLLGHIAVPGMTPYVVSKWAVRGLARQLTMENADLPGVHVAHVAPGSVDTSIHQHALDSDGSAKSAPPPTISPERAARTVYAQVDHPQAESQTAYLNYVLIGAFHLVPWAWNRLAGPLYRAASQH